MHGALALVRFRSGVFSRCLSLGHLLRSFGIVAAACYLPEHLFGAVPVAPIGAIIPLRRRGGLAELRFVLLQVFAHGVVRDVASVDDAYELAFVGHRDLLQVIFAQYAAYLANVGVHVN